MEFFLLVSILILNYMKLLVEKKCFRPTDRKAPWRFIYESQLFEPDSLICGV